MTRWQYRGSVTQTIEVPGVGGTVLRPRQVFEAPSQSVAALVARGLVVPLREMSPPVRKRRPKPVKVVSPVEIQDGLLKSNTIEPVSEPVAAPKKRRRRRAKVTVDSLEVEASVGEPEPVASGEVQEVDETTRDTESSLDWFSR